MRVAFLGLGTMGLPMAKNVAKAHTVRAWNRTPRASTGLDVRATAADAVADAEVIIMMLSDPAAVQAVYTAAPPVAGQVLIDMSTVDVDTSQMLWDATRDRGGTFIDAPVSGTRGPAESGSLLILAGGEPADLVRVQPVLQTMGRVLRAGGTTQGTAMKLVLNGLGAHMMTGFAALLGLGKRLGLSLPAMLEVIGSGAFSSPLYAGKGARIAAGDFSPDFKLRLMRKDQELVLAAAQQLGYEMPTEKAILEEIARADAAGLGEEDLCVLARWFGAV